MKSHSDQWWGRNWISYEGANSFSPHLSSRLLNNAEDPSPFQLAVVLKNFLKSRFTAISEVSFCATRSEHAAVRTTNTGRLRVEEEQPGDGPQCRAELIRVFFNSPLIFENCKIQSRANPRKDPSDPCIAHLVLIKLKCSWVESGGFASVSRGLAVKVLKVPSCLGHKCSQWGLEFFSCFCCSSFLFLSLLISSNLAEIELFNWRPRYAQKVAFSLIQLCFLTTRVSELTAILWKLGVSAATSLAFDTLHNTWAPKDSLLENKSFTRSRRAPLPWSPGWASTLPAKCSLHPVSVSVYPLSKILEGPSAGI